MGFDDYPEAAFGIYLSASLDGGGKSGGVVGIIVVNFNAGFFTDKFQSAADPLERFES